MTSAPEGALSTDSLKSSDLWSSHSGQRCIGFKKAFVSNCSYHVDINMDAIVWLYVMPVTLYGVCRCIDLKVQLITAVSAVQSQIIYQEYVAR